MKEKRNVHLKVQELCDCFATIDPLKEMSEINKETDKEEAALKWLALAALHGVNANAKKITILKNTRGEVKVEASYRVSELPSPDNEIASNVVKSVREITHLDKSKGESVIALGIRDSSIELKVKVKTKEGADRISLKFPE